MFVINIYLRFALIALLLIGGVILAAQFGFWYAFPFFLIGVVLLVGYVMLGTIQSAAKLMQTGDYEATKKRLNLTLTPSLLYVTNRAYFFMIKGSIAMAEKNNDEGEVWLKKAQEVKVPTDNEKAMIELQLANLAATKGKWKQAKLHMKTLKSLKVTEQTVKDQIKQLDMAVQNSGQLKTANRMGGGMAMRGGKSKRKRPKMR
ncbi:MAG: hypothetical protein HRU40_14615 [Saprospiraceae bacterium]|nr:hypothetical protein [Saprospiraceae bacterium]